MKKEIKQALENQNGYISSMRVNFTMSVFTSCIGGIGLGVLDIYFNGGKNLLGVASIIAALSGFAFWGKQKQAKIEREEIL